MNHRWLACLLWLSAAGTARADGVWDKLWHSADQRGEAYLQQGDAAAAARTFSDPRRKAFAELKAGDFAAAARDLASFDDRDAHYNRGNALARAGDLKAALAAYDAALARDPNDADARHNRDLVAQALKQPPPSPPPPPKSGSGSDQAKPPGSQASAGEGGASDPSGSQGSKPKEGAGASQPEAADAQRNNPGNSPGNDPGHDPNEPGKAQHPNAASVPDASSNPDRNASQSTPKDDATQARRDVLASTGPGASSASGRGTTASGDEALAASRAASAPRSEQQLAEDQWLRRIPDDPGGLLRRKFMIEHLMRQKQEGKP